MSTQKTLLTANEFFEQYSYTDRRYELVDGEVSEMAPVTEEHGGIASNINGAFYVYSRQSGIGRAGVAIGYRLRSGPDTVRSPDVSFRLFPLEEAQRTGFVIGAPDIAVEVVSPANTAAEMERKVREYLAAGSQRVWVVYPAGRRVAVHPADGSVAAYSGDGMITDEELLPGFSLPLSDIFR